MWHVDNKIMRFPVKISLMVIFFLNGNCVGGDDGEVMTMREFEDHRILAIAATTNRCSDKVEFKTQNENSIAILIESLRLGSGSLITLQFPKDLSEAYVTKKDANLCFSSIFTLPCSNDWIADIAIANMLYCNPARASLWQHQHFGQGEWSVPEGGPRF